MNTKHRFFFFIGEVKKTTQTHKKLTKNITKPQHCNLFFHWIHCSKLSHFRKTQDLWEAFFTQHSLHNKLSFTETTLRGELFLLFRFLLSGCDSSRCCVWLLVTLPEELPHLWGLQAASWRIFGESRTGGKDVKYKKCITRFFKYNQEIPIHHRDEKSTYWVMTPCPLNQPLYAGNLQGRKEYAFKREDRKASMS